MAFEVFDDGAGPAIYAGGVGVKTVAGISVEGLARWDGAQWSDVFAPGSPRFGGASGNPSAVSALETWNDGTGDAMYVGGYFVSVDGVPCSNVARWDGTSWTALGAGLSGPGWSSVTALLATNVGSLTALYAAGWFQASGGTVLTNVARWDGAAWTPLGAGLSQPASALAVHDDGSGAGSRLYAAGSHNFIVGGPVFSPVAAWDGVTWSAVGTGLGSSSATDLAVFDDGAGAKLYAAVSGAVMRWDGVAWTSVSQASGLQARKLAVHDDGAGPRLYGSGWRAVLSPFFHGWASVARLELGGWTDVGVANAEIAELESVSAGSGAELFAGGQFDVLGEATSSRIARFRSGRWRSVGSGGGRERLFDALLVHDGGGGPEVYAGSGRPNDVATEGVVRWDGSEWRAVGAPSGGSIHALAVHDSGAGPRLYSAGRPSSFGSSFVGAVAVFDGSAWQPVGTPAVLPPTLVVWTLRSWQGPSGPLLVAGGDFSSLQGVALSGIGAWNGTQWVSLGGGTNGTVEALGEYGGELLAGGQFTVAGNLAANGIARWNGSQWSPLGSGITGDVWSMRAFDDGSGPALYVGGQFTQAGGVSVENVARWNGSQWSAVGSGLDGPVLAMAEFDDGDGPKLFAAGAFTSSGGAPAGRLAKWNGTQWLEVDPTLSNKVTALARLDRAGGASSLFLAGSFLQAGGATARRIAEMRTTPPCPPVTYCTAQTNSLGCVPAIAASGVPSLAASTFRVQASQIVSQKTGLLFWGRASIATPFGGGTKCVAGPTVRTALQSSGGTPGGFDCTGAFDFAFSSVYLGSFPLAPGDRLYGQYWSRDPSGASSTNLTDALSFLLAP